MWGGIIFGYILSPIFLPYLVDFLSNSPVAAFNTSEVLLVVIVVGLGIAGYIVGRALSFILPPPFKLFDKIGGALFGLFAVCVFFWFTFPLFGAIGGRPQELSEESRIVSWFDKLPNAPIGGIKDQITKGRKIVKQINDTSQQMEEREDDVDVVSAELTTNTTTPSI